VNMMVLYTDICVRYYIFCESDP